MSMPGQESVPGNVGMLSSQDFCGLRMTLLLENGLNALVCNIF